MNVVLMVWLRLPLPDLQAHLFITALLGTSDLAQRAGVVDPLSAEARVVGPLLAKGPLNVEKWIWFRLRTPDERDWLGRLLKDCARSIETRGRIT